MITGMGLTGAGVGSAMSVASTAIVGNTPAHRMGMASSVDEVSYGFGSLLTVAFLGSLLPAIYSTTIVLPIDAPDAASASMLSALHTAAEAGSRGQQILPAARLAFDSGYIVTLISLLRP